MQRLGLDPPTRCLPRERFIVFCGINPGRWSAAAAAHFANPRNDFWRLLADAALTPRQLSPEEQWELLDLGFGLTNAAERTTPGSSDLRRADFAGAAERLEGIAVELHPTFIAFVGKAAYEGAFRERPALGLQERRLGETKTLCAAFHLARERCRSHEERLRWFRALGELVSAS